MKKSWLLLLTFLGAAIAVSSYLVWHHYALVNGDIGFGSFCSINQTIDCDAVNASSYSEIFGIPLGAWGLSYYLFSFIMVLWAWKDRFARRDILFLLTALSGLSVLASLATFSISAFILKKVCLMCGSLQLINVITFAIIFVLLSKNVELKQLSAEFSKISRPRILKAALSGIGLTLVLFFLCSQLRHEIPFDEMAFVNDFRMQPAVQVPSDGAPTQGFKGDNPPLRIVEFADFQCPACGMAAKQLHRLLPLYGDRVQFVFRNYPLDQACNVNIPRPMHPFACLAAKTAVCMHQQGKFAEMFEALFGKQPQISAENIRKWAIELGAKEAELDACVKDDATNTVIQKDIALATTLGLISTPTFFVNGRKVEGAIDEKRMQVLLREHGLSPNPK